MIILYRLSLILIFLMTLSCSSSKPEEFREEGVSITKNLIREFKKVKSRDELLDRTKKIESLFKQLTLVVSKAELYLKEHPELDIPYFSKDDQEASDELRLEINRLYMIEGCREIIESCERAALSA